MTQAIECAGVRRRSTGLSSLFMKAAELLRNNDQVIRPDALSRHTLRDIGMAEDVRANHLLSDTWMRR